MVPKVQGVAARLARSIKTGHQLESVNATEEERGKNQQHQQGFQKQLKVTALLCAYCATRSQKATAKHQVAGHSLQDCACRTAQLSCVA